MSTTEKMTIHKALSELKVMDDRILKAIGECDFVNTVQHSVDKINGKSVSAYCKDICSGYQKIHDLIKRRNAIKAAVVVSNAITKVKIGEVEYTVAEAIDYKNFGIRYYNVLKENMKKAYAKALKDIKSANNTLDTKVSQAISSIGGSNTTKNMIEEISKKYNELMENFSMDIVNPLDVEKEIEKISDMIDEFMVNVDSSLSVSNATTIIEVTY